ncbi:MAG: type VI secretion system tube protein Hcp [Novosphingobium sp.]|nr:type VI secretion system tube protein Hcp [Novosphingobium sp.]
MKFGKALKSAVAFSVLAFGFQGTAFAHKVVHVQNTLYVIICEPGGEAYTFNGTPQGATEIGGYLCPPSSTGATGGGGIIQAKPAPRDAASGLPTGKRQHKPMTVTKEVDKSSPMLAK